ncbi:MAG: GGDEF domain-containing protein [Burkholderiaceae bacterium]|nr:GGDEF domain-containing protein [Burkholderiaceae bacterium]
MVPLTPPRQPAWAPTAPTDDGAPPWPLSALVNLQAGVVVLDGTGGIVFVNHWFVRRCGRSAAELVGMHLSAAFPQLVGSYFCQRLSLSQRTGLPAVLSHSLHSPPLPLYMPHLVGHPQAVLSQTVHIIPLGRAAALPGSAHLTLVQVTDVTPTVRRESLLRTRVDQMHHMARVDPLTGVGNRREFSETLDSEVRAALRAGTPLGLLMIDIDHFKNYNDHYGHPAGDRCLRDVADLLRKVVRRPRDRLTRYGGEEFAVLLPATPLEGVAEVGRELVSRVRMLDLPHQASLVSDRVTVSVGAASLIPTGAEDAVTLVRHADEALYAAKGAGRDRLHVWLAPADRHGAAALSAEATQAHGPAVTPT